MKKFLITGYSGFLGRNLLDILTEETCIFLGRSQPTFQQPRSEWIQVADFRQFAEKVPQNCHGLRLIHLAWSADKDYLHDDTNSAWREASQGLVERFFINGGRNALIIGTSFELLSHDDPRLYSPYVQSKIELRDNLMREYSGRITWVQPHTLFGLYERRHRLVPTIINSLIEGQEFLPLNPEQRRDFTFANYASRSALDYFLSNKTGIFEACSGVLVSVQDMIDTIVQLFTRDVPLQITTHLHLPLLETIEYWRGIKSGETSRLES